MTSRKRALHSVWNRLIAPCTTRPDAHRDQQSKAVEETLLRAVRIAKRFDVAVAALQRDVARNRVTSAERSGAGRGAYAANRRVAAERLEDLELELRNLSELAVNESDHAKERERRAERAVLAGQDETAQEELARRNEHLFLQRFYTRQRRVGSEALEELRHLLRVTDAAIQSQERLPQSRERNTR